MKALSSIELTEKEKKAVIEAAQLLKSHLPVSRVVLFGSKATGQADTGSDIDLLFISSCPVSSKLRSKISEVIANINLQNDVALSSIVVSEKDWSEGLFHHTLIRSEIERQGCEV